MSAEGTAAGRAAAEQHSSQGETLHVRSGDVVIVPADTTHAFTNTGEGQLRQIDIHVNSTFETEWLE